MEIQKGLAIPLYSNGRIKKGWADVIRGMVQGDSVTVQDHSQMKSFVNTMRWLGVQHTAQKQSEGGYRVWHVGVRRVYPKKPDLL